MSQAEVVGYDEQADHPVDLDRWVQLARDVLMDEKVGTGELTLLFVDGKTMADLNEVHMGEARATDVLAFPIDDETAIGELVDDVPVMLGDVVVCPSVAMQNATEHAGAIVDEIALLVVHGVLHVIGYDHAEADETAVMQSRELALLERYHWRGDAPAGFLKHRQ